LVLRPLERELLAHYYAGQEGRRPMLVIEAGGAGAVEARLLEEDGAHSHTLMLYAGRMPLRAGSLVGAVVRVGGLDVESGLMLFEINRALVESGLLLLTTHQPVEAKTLLRYGFALVSEREEAGGPLTTLSRKVWRKYVGDSCPRCGSTLVLPLIPPDANVRKVWTVYCASCSYNWSVDEPITEWF
jgi:hypothetical protein